MLVCNVVSSVLYSILKWTSELSGFQLVSKISFLEIYLDSTLPDDFYKQNIISFFVHFTIELLVLI